MYLFVMAKKKKISREQLIDAYMSFIEERKKYPITVASLAKTYNFEEQAFYKHFKSTKQLDKEIYEAFITQTIALLLQSESYHSFKAREKLISFYYTLFELLKANRSYIRLSTKSKKQLFVRSAILKLFRRAFIKYIAAIDIEMIRFNEDTIDKLQLKLIADLAWLQFCGVFKFWIDDTSTDFEKTDILIEKSVNTGFDLINIQPVKSVIDLGKFLLNEKFKKQE